MKKLLSIFVAILIWFSAAPVEWIHQILEEHEEIHLCDYDYCVRSFSHECELDQTSLSKKTVIVEPNTYVITSEQNSTFIRITEHYPDKREGEFNPRGPPFFLI